MKKQIHEGLNMCMSGMPYWTLDIGGFFTVNENWQHRGCSCSKDPTPKWFWRGDYEEGVEDYGYRELYVRTFLNLWEALADENGDLIEEYAQPDGYHLLPAGYDAWVDYLCTHT